MATNLLSEQRLSLSQAASKVFGCNTSTTVRWALYGLRGGTLKLESFRCGGKRFTTLEACQRFIAAQNPDSTTTTIITAPSVEARIAAAERELAAAGI